ncbi:MAG TPA: GNAT family N-acetyltransferase [Gaiellaceae bacterium]
MELHVRPIRRDEFEEYVAVLEAGVGRRMTDEALEDATADYDVERLFAAFDGERMVGGTGSEALELTVPGPALLPAARITLAAVLPTHRRRGISTELNVQQLHDLRARGEPLAVFTTTGPGLYRRVGYSPATFAQEVELDLVHARLAVPASDGSGRLLAEDELSETLPPIFERHRLAQPGQISRTPLFWRFWLDDRERYRKGEPGDRMAVVFEDGGGDAQGYLTYRLRPGPPRDQPVDALVVEDLVAVTEPSRRELWRYCLAFHQARSLLAHNLPADEPLLFMLDDPRHLRATRLREFVWLRLVDVPAALEARRYTGSGSVALEVTDPVCSENAGRFRLEVEDGVAECGRTDGPAELALDVADLAAVYLGGSSVSRLARAGRIEELASGAIRRLDALFASWPAPWTVSDW